MASKIFYSKPLKFFWDKMYGDYKKLSPSSTEEQIFASLKTNILSSPLRQGETLESRGQLISGLELWKQDSTGDFLHIFFLDKKLRDFLETTRLSDLDGIRNFLYENGESKDVIYFKTNEKTNCVVYTFGIHIPFETNGYAFSLSLFENKSIELYFLQGLDSGRISDKFYDDLIKNQDEQSLALCKMFRLTINTLAYMKCFPECVSEGVPRISHDKNKERSANCITFQLSEKITDTENFQRAKMPHFRKGHFKLLQSDYYTNKKGQLIFVTETMVKGKAKTVSTTPEIKKFVGNS